MKVGRCHLENTSKSCRLGGGPGPSSYFVSIPRAGPRKAVQCRQSDCRKFEERYSVSTLTSVSPQDHSLTQEISPQLTTFLFAFPKGGASHRSQAGAIPTSNEVHG